MARRGAVSLVLTAVVVLFAACGSRTGLPGDLGSDSFADASFDGAAVDGATRDAADADADADALADAPVCVPTTKCGPRNCPDGCCAGGTCVRGDEAQRCGTHGEACNDCVRGQYDECHPTRHACAKRVPSCGQCVGCCDPTTLQCYAQGSSGACGFDPSLHCAPCDTGKLCMQFICLAPCGIDTCPSGCCQNGECVPGNADTLCGGFGEGCRNCTVRPSDHCDQQRCVTPVPKCDLTSCPSGCCATVEGKTSCVDGISARACGTAAQVCDDCVAQGLVCDLVTHRCKKPECSQ